MLPPQTFNYNALETLYLITSLFILLAGGYSHQHITVCEVLLLAVL